MHEPPLGRRPFTALSMIVEFADAGLRARTRRNVAVAEAEGRLREQQPKLEPGQEQDLVRLWNDGTHTGGGIADRSDVGRSTVCQPLHTALTTSSPPKSDRSPDHLKAAVRS